MAKRRWASSASATTSRGRRQSESGSRSWVDGGGLQRLPGPPQRHSAATSDSGAREALRVGRQEAEAQLCFRFHGGMLPACSYLTLAPFTATAAAEPADQAVSAGRVRALLQGRANSHQPRAPYTGGAATAMRRKALSVQ